MQGPVAQSLALVSIGNAALAGRDVSALWPGGSVFRYTKQCEFLEPGPGSDDWRQVAADPLAWFTSLQGRCKGFRLHLASRPPEPEQPPLPDRLTIAFVGGGPRWLIEAVESGKSRVWQGFDRLLDKEDPQQRIWAHGYLLQGELDPLTPAPITVASAMEDLARVLPDIESLARSMRQDPFADVFAAARATLEDDAAQAFHADVATLAGFDPASRRLLAAVERAWVFAGMGSWNDIPEQGSYAERYRLLSEALFLALQHGVVAMANATYRG